MPPGGGVLMDTPMPQGNPRFIPVTERKKFYKLRWRDDIEVTIDGTTVRGQVTGTKVREGFIVVWVVDNKKGFHVHGLEWCNKGRHIQAPRRSQGTTQLVPCALKHDPNGSAKDLPKG